MDSLAEYKYQLLFATYATVTGFAFWRIRRQPYNTSIKMEQYETVFKGTSLAAAVTGIAMSGSANVRRSQARNESG